MLHGKPYKQMDNGPAKPPYLFPMCTKRKEQVIHWMFSGELKHSCHVLVSLVITSLPINAINYS